MVRPRGAVPEAAPADPSGGERARGSGHPRRRGRVVGLARPSGDRRPGGVAGGAQRSGAVDLAQSIIDRTGLWSAAGERGGENLLRFLDLAAEFEPVDGDTGLAAFVEYVRLLDESEEDLAEAYTSGRDAVRVM